MSGPKIFLIVVIALAVLFVVGVGLGIGQNDRQATSPESFKRSFNPKDHGWLSKLNVFESGSAEFKPDGGGCQNFRDKVLTVARSATCDLVVPAAGRRMVVFSPPRSQSVKFQVVVGTVSFIRLPGDELNRDPDNNSPPSWNPGGEVRALTVGGGGGRLRLACVGTGACQLRFR